MNTSHQQKIFHPIFLHIMGLQELETDIFQKSCNKQERKPILQGGVLFALDCITKEESQHIGVKYAMWPSVLHLVLKYIIQHLKFSKS